MTKVDLENKVENLIAKKEELLNNKEIFKVNMDKIFSDFKNESFIPFFDQIKYNANNIFNDYIINAEEKLKKNDDSVEITLKSLMNEIEQITKNSENSLKVKYDDLKTKINLEKEKIQGLMVINNDIFREFKFVNSEIKDDKIIQFEDLAKPIAATFASIASISGVILGIVQGIGFAQCMAMSLSAGCTLGGIGAIAGGIVGLIGFGATKLYKEFTKKEDVIELCKKAQNEFINKFDNHYYQAKNAFDEDKKKIIDNICNGIDNYIMKLENAMNEMNKM